MLSPVEARAYLGRLVAAGLLSRDEAVAAVLAAANYPTDTRPIEDDLDRSTVAHEAAMRARIVAGIAPLIACRACPAAITAQARFINNCKGRINSLPDDDVIDIMRTEIAAAISRLKSGR